MFWYFDGVQASNVIIINNMTTVLKTLRGMQSSPCCLLHAGFLLGLLFNSEDRGDMFHWNVHWLTTDYTVLYPSNLSYPLLREPQILSVFICWTVEVHSIQVLHWSFGIWYSWFQCVQTNAVMFSKLNVTSHSSLCFNSAKLNPLLLGYQITHFITEHKIKNL
jgi:hypothetical protein